MLRSLCIKNIVLIKDLTIEFGPGLNVFTGETGAGKSILLDALSLALGARADQTLLAHGTEKGYVVAEFMLGGKDAFIRALLDAAGVFLEPDEPALHLKRTLAVASPSRAFVNDQPISTGLLKELSANLVEIHGQFDKLLEPKEHLAFLDAYANLDPLLLATKQAFSHWKQTQADLAQLRAQAGQERKILLEHYITELEQFGPQENELPGLMARRERLIHGERIVKACGAAATLLFEAEGAVHQGLAQAIRELEAVVVFDAALAPLLDSLNSALINIQEAEQPLSALAGGDEEGQNLEDVDERLATWKQLARKHNCPPEDLDRHLAALKEDFALLDNQEAALAQREKACEAAREKYKTQAKALSEARQLAGEKLEQAVKQELPALKMERALFRVAVLPLGENHWSEMGMDIISFDVAPNATVFGTLKQIASGGERSRFMLALKAALAAQGSKTTLVFDEIDAGVGGAVAMAIGARLFDLGRRLQVLCVTHSPQVAAWAEQHYRVEKTAADENKKDKNAGITTSVNRLSAEATNKELARMLSGAAITTEALAAATKLKQLAKPPKT